jgi:predicted MPP superfamily phosphohydrolase
MNKMNRRDFLGLGAGFLSLPALGVSVDMTGRMAPVSQVVVQPWNKGVLRPTMLKLEVGATRPFRAVHISDTHINFTDIEELYVNRRNYEAGCRRYARFPQSIPSLYASFDYAASKPDTLLIHTGDLIDFGTRATYSFLRHNFTGRDMIYAIGNHEYENADSTYDSDTAGKRRRLNESGLPGNLECASRIVNGVNFVSFNSAEYGKGIVSPTVREAVRREFDKGLPVVLMCHIPPFMSEEFRNVSIQGKVDLALQHGKTDAAKKLLTVSRKDIWTGDSDTADFWRQIREKDNFKAVLCGHCHWAWNEPFGRGRLCMAGGNYEGCLNDITFC